MDILNLQELNENMVKSLKPRPPQRTPRHTAAPLDLSFKSFSSVEGRLC